VKRHEIESGKSFETGKRNQSADQPRQRRSIVGVDEAIIRQRNWHGSSHIDIDGKEAAFMPLRPCNGDTVYKLLGNGNFYAGDTKLKITSFAYKVDSAIELDNTAKEMIRKEMERRNDLTLTEIDQRNWALLEEAA
jgi:hypothetical protein